MPGIHVKVSPQKYDDSDNVEIMYNMFGQGEGVGITEDIWFGIAML